MSVSSTDDGRTPTSGGPVGAQPPEDPNSNALVGFMCPQCGQREHVEITAEATIVLTDNGVTETTDPEWHDYSTAKCPDCELVNVVTVFFVRTTL